jgi:hypothetical protein
VTLRARWVTLRARWVTRRARWVTLRARGAYLTAPSFSFGAGCSSITNGNLPLCNTHKTLGPISSWSARATSALYPKSVYPAPGGPHPHEPIIHPPAHQLVGPSEPASVPQPYGTAATIEESGPPKKTAPLQKLATQWGMTYEPDASGSGGASAATPAPAAAAAAVMPAAPSPAAAFAAAAAAPPKPASSI